MKWPKTSKEISERMRRVKSKGTRLEKEMEKILRSLDIRYVRQPNIFGHPDFRIKQTRILIFCDSAFWHGRRKKEITGKAFKKNRELWINKLKTTLKRDRKINRVLRKEGWSVHRFLDKDILKNQNRVINRLSRMLENAKKDRPNCH